ncbi:MAG: hypothetical protein A2W17_09115 [Planctomycetes bacterium RBG_16_41_13]|nr:MAG: hypothetical protein A2W17_09115 [Planctomycetes bacterium RBG_16_41_13]
MTTLILLAIACTLDCVGGVTLQTSESNNTVVPKQPITINSPTQTNLQDVRFVDTSFSNRKEPAKQIWSDTGIVDAKVYGNKKYSHKTIQKAIDAIGSSYKTLNLSEGKWLISSDMDIPANIKLNIEKGATIDVAKGKRLTIRGLIESPVTHIFTGVGEVVFDTDYLQTVYPQWWGAKGDGLTEDTVSVQAAINSFTSKGGDIFFPDGTYIVDSIGIKSNITAKGNGQKSILKQKSGSQYCVGTNPYNGKIKRGDLNPTNIEFINLGFRGTVDADGFSEFFMLLDIRAASKIYVSKCSFIGFRGDGIYLGEKNLAGAESHNTKVTISECVFDGINKDNRNGISIIDGDGLLIEKCIFRNCSRPDMPGAIDVEPDSKHNIVRNIKIAENRFENIGGHNIIQISITFKFGKLDTPIQNIEIVKNIIEGDKGANGIYIGQPQFAEKNTPSNNILIHDNVVKNTNRSFMLFGFKNVSMFNNLFDECNNAPYISYSESNINVMDMHIIANTFKNLSQDDGLGVSIFGVHNITFKDNTFENIGKVDGTYGNALYFRRHGGAADYVAIENNIFRGNNTKVAVQREKGNVTYPEHNRIKDNTCVCGETIFLPAGNLWETP